MENEEKKSTLGEKFLKAEQSAAFHYGHSMVKFAKAYHMLIEMEQFLPDELELRVGYPEDLEISFSQLPDQPEKWKEVYQTFRRHGWERVSVAEITNTKMELHLMHSGVLVSIEVSFPLCSVEVIGKKMVERPIYKIVCDGPKLEDPEPQTGLASPISDDLAF